MVLRKQTGWNKHKLRYKKLFLNIKTAFYDCEDGQTLGQIAQKLCEVSIAADLLTGQ